MIHLFKFQKLIVAAALLTNISVSGQDTPRSQHYFSIGHENDFLNVVGPLTDQYYTGGVFVQYSSYTKSGHGLGSKLLFAPGHPDRSFYKTGLSFWMYSPTDLRLHTAQQGDYPYSGTLFLDLSRETMPTNRSLFRSEIWLGFTGPLAQGQWAQQTLHRSLHFIIPRGWDNQLPNSPVLNYNLYYEKNLAALSDHVFLNGLGYAQVGSTIDAVKAGAVLAFSSNSYDYFPVRVYAINKTEQSHRMKFFAEITPAVKLVGYNSLIEGRLFTAGDSYHIAPGDLARVMFEGTGAIGFRTHGFSFSYREIYQTKEFRSVHYHIYGSIFITAKL